MFAFLKGKCLGRFIRNTAKLTFKVIFSSIGILIAYWEYCCFFNKNSTSKNVPGFNFTMENRFVGEFCGIAFIP